MNDIIFAVAATLVLQIFWERRAAKKVIPKTELEQIAVLQHSAAARRAEYAAEKERVLREAPPLSSNLLSSSQRQVQEAEVAYALALQAWENRQFRQNSR